MFIVKFYLGIIIFFIALILRLTKRISFSEFLYSMLIVALAISDYINVNYIKMDIIQFKFIKLLIVILGFCLYLSHKKLNK
jgi:hypothetical protein